MYIYSMWAWPLKYIQRHEPHVSLYQSVPTYEQVSSLRWHTLVPDEIVECTETSLVLPNSHGGASPPMQNTHVVSAYPSAPPLTIVFRDVASKVFGRERSDVRVYMHAHDEAPRALSRHFLLPNTSPGRVTRLTMGSR